MLRVRLEPANFDTSTGSLVAMRRQGFALCTRKAAERKLQDQQYDMYERAATYEGVEVNSKTAPVRGNFLPTKVQMLNDAVVQHVAEVSFHKYKINRMVLNFKVDPNDQLWLLWCSSMRLEGAPAGGEPPAARARA